MPAGIAPAHEESRRRRKAMSIVGSIIVPSLAPGLTRRAKPDARQRLAFHPF